MSTTETTSSVIPSTNRDRYALSEPDEGDDLDLTCGDALSIILDEGSAGYCWTIGELSGIAVDVLEAVSPGLHCVHLDCLERQERRPA